MSNDRKLKVPNIKCYPTSDITQCKKIYIEIIQQQIQPNVEKLKAKSECRMGQHRKFSIMYYDTIRTPGQGGGGPHPLPRTILLS